LNPRAFLYGLAQRSAGVNYGSPLSSIREATQDGGRLVAFNDESMRRLLSHTFRNVPYYHNVLSERGVVSEEGIDPSLYSSLPILTRGAIRAHSAKMMATGIRGRRAYLDSTGGTSGEPLEVWKDRFYDGWRIAAYIYHCEDMIGLDYFRSRKLAFDNPRRIPSGLMRRKSSEVFSNSAFLSQMILTESGMMGHLDRWNSYRPDIVHAFSEALFELALLVERRGIEVRSPKAMVTLGSVLDEDVRKKIEEVFGCRVYDFYGAVEAGAIAGECGSGTMHVFSFETHVELLQRSGLGDAREVIITPLHNFAMPLIRYSIGDTATPKGGRCPCGSPLPKLGKVVGRTIDYLRREDGTLILGSYFTPLFSVGSVNGFQIVQEDFRRIRILLAGREVDGAWRTYVEGEFRRVMGSDCRIAWEEVDRIPQAPVGKRIVVRCLING
jgi:phenylacetate-CoA ligase